MVVGSETSSVFIIKGVPCSVAYVSSEKGVNVTLCDVMPIIYNICMESLLINVLMFLLCNATI